ncbi:MAG TPA: isoprenylcysteine carboxylmethyltransferase family protein [Vicinamibacterales bacterium]|nr:isoprenylcysteine carboxylmethyltransferase family protein [Vicinamibacterales bacterium]
MTGGSASGHWQSRLARLRVPLGFLAAAAAFLLATPTPGSLLAGLLVALPGEVLRVWAAGHIDKGREITTSGPYRFTRHPLYLGSTILGIGFAIAAHNWVVAAIVAGYLGLTLAAAIRTEERTLDERFEGAYTRYREGALSGEARPFSLARVVANREHRAVMGLVASAILLVVRWWWS